MIRTDVYNLRAIIKNIERTEVIEAINYFGGSYKWDEEKDEANPILLITPDSCEPCPIDLYVQSVTINPHNEIIIRGYENGNPSNQYSITDDDVCCGYLTYIIDYLPESDIDVRYEKENRDAKLCRDGFVWKIVTPDKARDIWKAGLFELYKLYPDNSEGLIEREVELEEAISQGIDIGIEVGFIG